MREKVKQEVMRVLPLASNFRFSANIDFHDDIYLMVYFGTPADAKTSAQEVRLLHRAFRKRWPTGHKRLCPAIGYVYDGWLHCGEKEKLWIT